MFAMYFFNQHKENQPQVPQYQHRAGSACWEDTSMPKLLGTSSLLTTPLGKACNDQSREEISSLFGNKHTPTKQLLLNKAPLPPYP